MKLTKLCKHHIAKGRKVETQMKLGGGQMRQKAKARTMVILEVHPPLAQHGEGHLHVVDLLEAADGRQTQPLGQAPVLGEQLHHAPGGTTAQGMRTSISISI